MCRQSKNREHVCGVDFRPASKFYIKTVLVLSSSYKLFQLFHVLTVQAARRQRLESCDIIPFINLSVVDSNTLKRSAARFGSLLVVSSVGLPLHY